MPDDPVFEPPYLDAEVRRELHRRVHVTPGEPINRDLGRYYLVLHAARRSLHDRFTPGELGLILDALNGTAFTHPWAVAHVLAEIDDAIRLDRLDQKWQVAAPHLRETLQGLSDLQRCALVDAVERWWSRVGQGAHDLAPEAIWEEEP